MKMTVYGSTLMGMEPARAFDTFVSGSYRMERTRQDCGSRISKANRTKGVIA